MKDLRLAPLALGCWAAALAMLFAGWWAGPALLAVGFLAIRPSWRWVAGTAFLGVALGVAATGARLSIRDDPAVSRLVAAHASASVTLTVRDDPRLARSATGRAPTWAVPATLRTMDIDRAQSRLEVRVVVLAQDGTWSGLLPGQRVRASVRFSPSRGGDLTAATLSASSAPELVGAPPWWQTAAGRIRAGLQRACAPMSPLPGGLLPGLVVGDTSRLDPQLAQQFRDVGLTHLVAVSGSNVG